jgi:gas vesicle protein
VPETNNRRGGDGAFFFGALIGSLIGTIVALWFAPRSGKELREEVEQSADELRRRIEGESVEESIQAGKAEARKLNQSRND